MKCWYYELSSNRANNAGSPHLHTIIKTMTTTLRSSNRHCLSTAPSATITNFNNSAQRSTALKGTDGEFYDDD